MLLSDNPCSCKPHDKAYKEPPGWTVPVVQVASVTPGGSNSKLPRDDVALNVCPMISLSGWRYRVHTVSILSYMVVFSCGPHRAKYRSRKFLSNQLLWIL